MLVLKNKSFPEMNGAVAEAKLRCEAMDRSNELRPAGTSKHASFSVSVVDETGSPAGHIWVNGQRSTSFFQRRACGCDVQKMDLSEHKCKR